MDDKFRNKNLFLTSSIWWQSLPKLKLGSNDQIFYADFEFHRFVFGKLCRKAPQQKRANEVTNFTNKKGTILKIFQKSSSTLALWELIPQKLWSFEQNPSGMALVMTCRVCLTKKVNLSFWRVLVTVPWQAWLLFIHCNVLMFLRFIFP